MNSRSGNAALRRWKSAPADEDNKTTPLENYVSVPAGELAGGGNHGESTGPKRLWNRGEAKKTRDELTEQQSFIVLLLFYANDWQHLSGD